MRNEKRVLSALINGYRGSQLMSAVVELDALRPFPEVGISVDLRDAAVSLDLPKPRLRRLYRIMVSYGLLVNSEIDVFQMSKMGGMLKDQNSSFFREAKSLSTEYILTFSKIAESIRTGKPAFELEFGLEFFEFLSLNPDVGDRHDLAMADISLIPTEELAIYFDFGRFECIFDLGCGLGTLAKQVLSRYDVSEYTLFDLPHVIEAVCKDEWINGFRDTVKTISGDFFESVPAGGDLYVLKWVLHDWSDEEASIILRNCRAVLGNGGKILVADWIVPKVVTSSTISIHADYTMLAFHRGRERTILEFSELFQGADLQVESVNTLPSGRAIILITTL